MHVFCFYFFIIASHCHSSINSNSISFNAKITFLLFLFLSMLALTDGDIFTKKRPRKDLSLKSLQMDPLQTSYALGIASNDESTILSIPLHDIRFLIANILFLIFYSLILRMHHCAHSSLEVIPCNASAPSPATSSATNSVPLIFLT